MTEKLLVQEWVARPERGALPLIKLGVWIALRLGRRAARLFLYPVCLYFLASSPAASRSSRAYLARALGRRPRLGDIFVHFLTFASCVLDRVFLLNERSHEFDIEVHGEEIVREIEQRGGGCLLFGAHFGSFEVTRAIGRRGDVPVSLLMYEENAKKTRAALARDQPPARNGSHRRRPVGFTDHGGGTSQRKGTSSVSWPTATSTARIWPVTHSSVRRQVFRKARSAWPCCLTARS